MADFLGWKADPSRYFGTPEPTFEKLRKPIPPDAPYELVETSYYGCSIPEENIHCEVYHWAHPKYGVTSGGIAIFRGIKKHQWNADFLEYQSFQRIPDDITDCTYADGVRIKVIEPGKEIQIDFDDPSSNTSVHFVSKAIMPPAFRHTGGHITQALRTTGTLVLRGKSYKVDNYFTRDRSWGDPRSEARLDLPPIGWHAAVFGDDLAFHVTAFESTDLKPALESRYPNVAGGKNHIWGYVWKQGKLLGVKSCSKVMIRDADNITAKGVQLSITDETGTTYRLKGTMIAMLPMVVWQNALFYFGLMRWTLEGDSRTGIGEAQECIYDKYILENYQEGR